MTPRLTLTMTAVALLVGLSARADDDDDGEATSPITLRTSPGWKAYAAECGSCHLAFDPRLLPARSWKKLLGGLADHFNQNAEVDVATRKALEAFLAQNAGRDVAGPTPLRITELPSWKREHREVPERTFKRQSISSAANCGACHPAAASGDFDEDRVKIPR
jgi:cytochrome c553